MNLLNFYEAILATGAFVVNDDATVSSVLGFNEKPSPAQLSFEQDGETVFKRLVLPTPEQLSHGDWTNRVCFHPLKENLLNGESDVLAYLRKAINYRINLNLNLLFLSALKYAADPSSQKRLNNAQMELLSSIKDADNTMVGNFEKMMRKLTPTNTRDNFVSIYLRKLGTFGGKKHSVVCVINFPIYKELLEADKEVLGVKLRKKDISTFISMIEWMFPEIKEEEAYNYGSNSKMAPFTESLMHSVAKLIQGMNKATTLLFKDSKHIPKEEREQFYEYLLIRDDFTSTLDNLDSLKKEVLLIPMQSGNEGKSVQKETRGQEVSTISRTEEEDLNEEMPKKFNRWHTIKEPVSNAQVQPTLTQQSQWGQAQQQPQAQPTQPKSTGNEVTMSDLPWARRSVANNYGRPAYQANQWGVRPDGRPMPSANTPYGRYNAPASNTPPWETI